MMRTTRDQLLDESARRVAATDFSVNLVVSAGAGTGKTSLLIERFLHALIAEGIDLSRICAVTFTEKAAAEMMDRLVKSLESIVAYSSGKAFDEGRFGEAERAWRLWEKDGLSRETIALRAEDAWRRLDEARLTTVHGFCSEILRRHSYDAGVSIDFEVDDGLELEMLVDRVWPSILERGTKEGANDRDLWIRTLLHLELASIKQVLIALCGFNIQTDRLIESKAPEKLGEDRLQLNAGGLARKLEEALSQVGDTKENALLRRSRLTAEFLRRVEDEGFSGVAPSFDSDSWKDAKVSSTPAGDLKGTELGKSIRELHSRASLFMKNLENLDLECGADLFKILLPVAAEIREQYTRRGFVSFDGLLLKTRDLLLSNSEIRRQEKQRLSHLMIDEFQDTDPVQYEIAFLLAESSEGEGRDPFSLTLEPGRLFIVGDAKQSIYRFRGADMRAFERAVNCLSSQGAVSLELSTNFRSPSALLRPINQLFQASFREVSGIQPKYQDIESAKGEGNASSVEVWTVKSHGNVSVNRRDEGLSIAQWIVETFGQGKPKWRDAAILFRALTAVPAYIRALREFRIPYVLEGGRTFFERPEVSDLIGFLKAASDPYDAISLLTVLRSPLGACPDQELARYAKEDHPWTSGAKVDPSSFPRIARAFELIQSFRKRHLSDPPDVWVYAALEETPLLLASASAYEGAQRVANLRKLAYVVSKMSRQRQLSMEETLSEIEERYADRRAEPESPLADEKLNAVRVLTIHKSKGLEFPCVIIPDTGRLANLGGFFEPVSARWLSALADHEGKSASGGEGALALKVHPKTLSLAEVFRTPEENPHQEAELMRLFYVALTRATDKVVLVRTESAKNTNAPWVKALDAWGLASVGDDVNPRLLLGGDVIHKYVVPQKSGGSLNEAGFEAEVRPWIKRFRDDKERVDKACRPWLGAPSQLSKGTRPKLDSIVQRDSEFARVAGTAVHRVLESWRFDQELPDYVALVREIAAQGGCDEESVLDEVSRLLVPFAQSEIVRHLAGVDILGREVPLLWKDDERVWSGNIDLIYRVGERLIIADYKTEFAGEKTKELAIAHRPQLDNYAIGLKHSWGLETLPDREIIFLDPPSIVPLGESEPYQVDRQRDTTAESE